MEIILLSGLFFNNQKFPDFLNIKVVYCTKNNVTKLNGDLHMNCYDMSGVPCYVCSTVMPFLSQRGREYFSDPLPSEHHKTLELKF